MTDSSAGHRVYVTRTITYDYVDHFFTPEGALSIELDPQRLKFLPGGQEGVKENVQVTVRSTGESAHYDTTTHHHGTSE